MSEPNANAIPSTRAANRSRTHRADYFRNALRRGLPADVH